MTTLYLSATGNSLYAAKTIGGEVVSIPQALKHKTAVFSDEKIGLAFPVYYMTVPPPVVRFLKTTRFECSYLYAVLTYGMFGGAASDHLQQVAREAGLSFSYVNTLKMADNWVPGFDMGKQKKLDPKKEVDAHLAEIAADIRASKQWIRRHNPFAKLVTAVMRGQNDKKAAVFAQSFWVQDTCTECGICARVCPVGNIAADHARPVFDARCIRCLACTHNCPANAIRVPGEKSEERYRNPHITLQEIIQSNEQ